MNLTDLKYSLVLATVDRTDELMRFLSFLDKQTYRNFELIIVDQNGDDRLLPIIAPYYDKFSVLHIRSKRGLSRARNVGLRHISGDIIAFPDDDCSYPRELLANVVSLFNNNQTYDGVTGVDVSDNNMFLKTRSDNKDGFINRYNVWLRAISFTIFLRAEVIKTVGDFDELLGLGSGTPWGSTEETDYLIRAILLGKKIFYSRSIEVEHTRINQIEGKLVFERTFSYAPGVGYVFKKHNYPLWFVLWAVARPFFGAFHALFVGNQDMFIVRLMRAKGILSGWNGARGIFRN